jgi:hypothetical protein
MHFFLELIQAAVSFVVDLSLSSSEGGGTNPEQGSRYSSGRQPHELLGIVHLQQAAEQLLARGDEHCPNQLGL